MNSDNKRERSILKTSSADEPSTISVPGATQPSAIPADSSASFPFLKPSREPGDLGWLAHYRILRLIGQGGMGMVFLAEDSQLRRNVALKVMRPDLATEMMRKRFLREARACAAVEATDHIVAVYQVGEEDGVPFLAMQHLRGMPLGEWLKQGKRLPLTEVLRIGRETAAGLAKAHSHGLIHRDIKPSNLWLEAPKGRVKILDFGLARPMESESNDEITQAGGIVGTIGYMAPEQADGEHVDARTDLFSLGCVLYELTAGKLPYRGKGILGYLKALTTHTPESLESLVPSVPPAFSDLAARLIDADPDRRPDSADDVIAELEAIERQSEAADYGRARVEDDASLFGELTEIDEPRRPVKKTATNVKPWLIAAGAGLVLVLIAVIYLATRDKSSPAARTNDEKADPKEPGGQPKTALDRPMDEQERPLMAKLSVEEQVRRISNDLARYNRGGFKLNRPNAIRAETFGGASIKSIEIEAGQLDELRPLRALPDLQQVTIKGEKKLVRLKGLAGLPLTFLSCQQAEVDLDDLGPMTTLKYLDLNGSTVKTLAAVSRFAVDTLNLAGSGMERIDALKSIPTLRKLDLANNPVADLTPLRGLPIEYLDITDCKSVVDIAALAEMPLTELRCTYQPAFKSLREHKTLRQINMKSRDEFFKE